MAEPKLQTHRLLQTFSFTFCKAPYGAGALHFFGFCPILDCVMGMIDWSPYQFLPW